METIVINAERHFDTLTNTLVSGDESVDRIAEDSGSHPEDIGRYDVNLGKLTEHVIIQDVSNVGWWANIKGGRLYDALIRNVGWHTPGDTVRKGGRHGFVYIQNYPDEAKGIDTCVVLKGLGYAFKIYYTGPKPVIGKPVPTPENKIAKVTIKNTIIYGTERDMLVGGETRGAEDITIDNCVIVSPSFAFGYKAADKRLTLKRSTVFGKIDTTSLVDGMTMEDVVIIQSDKTKPAFEVATGKFVTNFSCKNITIYTDNPNPIRGTIFIKGQGATRLTAESPGVTIKPLAEAPAKTWVFPVEGLAYPTANVFVFDPAGTSTVPLPAEWAGATAWDWRQYRGEEQLYADGMFHLGGKPTEPLNWDEATYGSMIPPASRIYGVFRVEQRPVEPEEEDPAMIAELQSQLQAAQVTIDTLTGELDTLRETVAERNQTIRALNTQLAGQEPAVQAIEALRVALEAGGADHV